jgi:hypothetical protein
LLYHIDGRVKTFSNFLLEVETSLFDQTISISKFLCCVSAADKYVKTSEHHTLLPHLPPILACRRLSEYANETGYEIVVLY